VTFFVGSSSGSSSIRGFDMLGGMSVVERVSRLTLSDLCEDFNIFVVCALTL
jgi:hypothetical protein